MKLLTTTEVKNKYKNIIEGDSEMLDPVLCSLPIFGKIDELFAFSEIYELNADTCLAIGYHPEGKNALTFDETKNIVLDYENLENKTVKNVIDLFLRILLEKKRKTNFKIVKYLIENVRTEYFTSKNLKTEEGIFYANGKNGTQRDLECNGFIPAFEIRKDNGDCVLKFFLNRDKTYQIYIYDFNNPFDQNITKLEGKTKLFVKSLGYKLLEKYDDNHKFDCKIVQREI